MWGNIVILGCNVCTQYKRATSLKKTVLKYTNQMNRGMFSLKRVAQKLLEIKWQDKNRAYWLNFKLENSFKYWKRKAYLVKNKIKNYKYDQKIDEKYDFS